MLHWKLHLHKKSVSNIFRFTIIGWSLAHRQTSPQDAKAQARDECFTAWIYSSDLFDFLMTDLSADVIRMRSQSGSARIRLSRSLQSQDGYRRSRSVIRLTLFDRRAFLSVVGFTVSRSELIAIQSGITPSVEMNSAINSLHTALKPLHVGRRRQSTSMELNWQWLEPPRCQWREKDFNKTCSSGSNQFFGVHFRNRWNLFLSVRLHAFDGAVNL